MSDADNRSVEISFEEDVPTADPSKDLLNRGHFVDSLVKAIGGIASTRGIVVGLCGPWGSGKSSVKDMAVRQLRSAYPDLHVVEFNPWRWSGQEGLIAAFFSEIGIAMQRGESGLSGWWLSRKWSAYGKMLSGLRGVFERKDRLALAFGALGAMMGIGKVTPKMSLCFLLIGLVIETFDLLVDFATRMSEGVLTLRERSLEEQRDVLRNALSKWDRRLLVVVDDVDRLEAQAVREVFQCIKANADFPRVTFLVLFEREQVEASLTVGGVTGTEYLEKLVQVMVDMPLAQGSRIQVQVDGVLTRRLGKGTPSPSEEKTHWAEVYYAGLPYLCQTLRQVKRLENSLRLLVGLHTGANGLEVNEADLAALEALRLAVRPAYRWVLRSKGELVPGARPPRSEEKAMEALGSAFEAMLKDLPEEQRRVVGNLLRAMFPILDGAVQGVVYSADRETWARERRMCHADYFDRYLIYGVADLDISEAEMGEVVEASKGWEPCNLAIEQYASKGLFVECINKVILRRGELSREQRVNFIGAIAAVGVGVPEAPRRLYDSRVALDVGRGIHWLGKASSNSEERAEVFVEAMRRSRGVGAFVNTLRSEDNANERAQHPEYFGFEAKQLPELKAACVSAIKGWASKDGLESSGELSHLLTAWSDWGRTEEVEAWAAELVRADDGFLRLLRGYVVSSQRYENTGFPVAVEKRVDLSLLSRVCPLSVLERRLKEVSLGKILEVDKGNLELLGVALRADAEAKATAPKQSSNASVFQVDRKSRDDLNVSTGRWRTLANQLQNSLRRQGVLWGNERDSDPRNLVEGKVILEGLLSALVEFQLWHELDSAPELAKEMSEIAKAIKGLLRLELVMDGGETLRGFWRRGSECLQRLSEVQQKMASLGEEAPR